MRRQAVLDDPGRRFEFLMSEPALRRQLVSSKDMRAQVRRLVDLSRRSNVELELIKFDAEEAVHQYHRFSVIGDPELDGAAIVLAETVTRALTIRGKGDVAEYVEHLTALRRGAIRGDELRAFRREVLGDLRG
jgi:hypothetical protein